MKKVVIMVMAIGVITVLALFGNAVAADVKLPQQIVWNHTQPPGLVTEIYQSLWATMEKATNKQITIKSVQRLYKAEEALEACIAGGLKIVNGTPYELYSLDPGFDLFDLPMLFDDFDHLIRFTNSEAWKGFVADFEKKSGLRLIPGTEKFMMFKMVIYSSYPVTKIDDIKGHAMRVLTGPSHALTAKALETNGVVVSPTELPVAIQTGMFDTMVASLSVSWVKSMGVLDKMKYFVMPPMITSNVMIFYNSKWFHSLPDNIQKALDDATRAWQPEATAKYRDFVDVESYKYVKTQATENVFSKNEVLKWRGKVKSVHDDYLKHVPNWGKKLLDAVEATRKQL